MKLETEYVDLAITPATKTSVFDLRNRVLRGIVFPSDWVGTAAVTFEVGVFNQATGVVDYVPVQDLTVAVSGASKVYGVTSTSGVAGFGRILGLTKLVTTAQAGARKIGLLTEQRT